MRFLRKVAVAKIMSDRERVQQRRKAEPPTLRSYHLHVVSPSQSIDIRSLPQKDQRKIGELNQKILQAPMSKKQKAIDDLNKFLLKVVKREDSSSGISPAL
jgi:hypothetical protein